MARRLFLDSWPPEHLPAVTPDGESLPGGRFAGEVDTRPETTDWAAISAHEELQWTPNRIHFIDGVRRLEARVLSEDTLTHGLLASVGTGAVVCSEDEKPAWEALAVERWLIMGDGKSAALEAGNGISFKPFSTHCASPEDLTAALQELMRTREAETAAALASDTDCVFSDGPLSYHTLSTHRVTGVVKRIILTYLDNEHMAVVRSLETTERTPVFTIRDGKYDRYSWFQRLAPRRATEHPLSGIARLEVRASLGIDAAVEIATFAARALPCYASSSVRDARAPQNLVPVGALEAELRHRLGDPILIRRAIEQAIAGGVNIIDT